MPAALIFKMASQTKEQGFPKNKLERNLEFS
jgi:hypothetical protein